MKPILTATLCSVIALAGCDSANPFMDETEEAANEVAVVDPVVTTPSDPNSFNIAGGGVPPGVGGVAATPDESIIRYEEMNDKGGGRAEEFSYDAATDTFSVDNLAFDGEDPYTRETIASIASLGPNDQYAVYEAQQVVSDPLDGDPIGQIAQYRAIVGISNATTADGAARTSFAIVRTGGYTDYGFGGFIYQREGNVVMPSTGQATFRGDYAGMRIFSGSGGLEFTEADMFIALDFDDPTDAVAGVRGGIFNRVAYDIDGNLIDSTAGGTTQEDELPLPGIAFVLDGDNGNASADGELTGGLALNSYFDDGGNEIDHESGTYYAIVAGDTTQPDGGEIVGIAVIDSTDPRTDVEVQETGGFILYRDDSYIP